MHEQEPFGVDAGQVHEPCTVSAVRLLSPQAKPTSAATNNNKTKMDMIHGCRTNSDISRPRETHRRIIYKHQREETDEQTDKIDRCTVIIVGNSLLSKS